MKKWGAGAMCGFSSAAHRHIDMLTYRVIYIPSYGKWLGPVYDVQLSFWGDGGMFFFGGRVLWKRSLVFPEVPADLFLLLAGGWSDYFGQFGISGGKPPSFRWYFVDQHSVAYGESQHLCG